jgi:hypothetical protein
MLVVLTPPDKWPPAVFSPTLGGGAPAGSVTVTVRATEACALNLRGLMVAHLFGVVLMSFIRDGQICRENLKCRMQILL